MHGVAGGRPESTVGEPSGRTLDAHLRTFLIADIRGYTAYTKERGDEAAGELAARFAELTRSAVGANDGDLLELRGDEALAVFLSARRALRAAIDLQARIAEDSLPRAVGIGLDAGEAVEVEGGFRGAALNIAARLCGQAGPGDVIASETVVNLAGPVEGIAFGEAKSYRLKGLEEPVRAVRVVAKGAASSRLVSRGRPSSPAHLLRKHRTIAAAAVAMVALIVAGAALLGGVLGGPSPTSSPPAAIASSSAVPSAAPASSPIAAAGTGTLLCRCLQRVGQRAQRGPQASGRIAVGRPQPVGVRRAATGSPRDRPADREGSHADFDRL